MERNIKFLKQSRETTLKAIQDLTFDQLCKIPEGYNNSIFWNIAHLAVTQQLLCYSLSGTKMYIEDQAIIDGFRKGSKPKSNYSQAEWKTMLNYFKTLPALLEKDWQANRFDKPFKLYRTSFGVELNSIEDAITFNNIHEGMHFGYILALRKLV